MVSRCPDGVQIQRQYGDGHRLTRELLAAGSGWWQALNPAIYLVSLLPGVGVWQLTRPAGPTLAALVLATLGVVLVQHAINLFNDASDWRLGADADKGDSWVRVHGGDSGPVLLHGWLSLAAAAALGLVALAGVGRLWILAIGAPLLALGYLYNAGRRPLSYTRLGEWVTGVCYGPGVVGCLWLLTGARLDWRTLLAMAAFGALAVSLLLSHQPPQIESDRQAGKHSFAVRFGADQTFRVSRLLFVVFVITWGLAVRHAGSRPVLTAMIVAVGVLAIGAVMVVRPSPKRVLLTATLVVLALLGADGLGGDLV
jgi:1,4-dihydroxy-2-naphthoate octaprenyltransferase